jgi:hypothetical protein
MEDDDRLRYVIRFSSMVWKQKVEFFKWFILFFGSNLGLDQIRMIVGIQINPQSGLTARCSQKIID